MADVHSEKVRSFNMSRIRSKDTRPELDVRKFLFANGFRYRRRQKFTRQARYCLLNTNKVIFVHGCFWHGHKNCKYFVIPKTRTEWWLNKINSNKQRDLDNFKTLLADKWRILTIFECELKPEKRSVTLKKILKKLQHK
ncbi:MAG: DNA mismatch endonuclease Vsr [Crocinitomicaceae bacterium]|nr:DNA mismatch endonuclease Vsr [Crocinitomicaceae bacterium]